MADEPSQQPNNAPGGSNGEGPSSPAAVPAQPNADQPLTVHRTGGPPVDPDVAAREAPGANGNGDGEVEVVPLDATGQPAEEPDRLAAPVGLEQPPKLPFVVVGVGASAGGVEAFTEFLVATPSDTGMAFVLIVHLPPDRDSLMADVLSKRTRMPVVQVEDGMAVEANHVYVIRPGRTLLLADGKLRLTDPLEARGHMRPVDDFFRSLAVEQRERAIGVILSGMGSNGAAGAQAIKAVGGVCIAQEPESALYPSMPRHLIDQGNADYVLRPRDIPGALTRFAGHPYARGPEAASVVLLREQQDFADVLAILRTRTRQDFSGYKRPTLFRRIQRRMGLNQINKLGDYVRLLRNNAAEVQALADDLLIHVTGFFRDPGAWQSLGERVIQPLVAGRDVEQSVRCWVTACSTGEEAYSLAMLIAEAMDKFDKQMEVKIFATDMAERSLGHARSGTFPLGIESEVSPERLERFFDREDSVYRVKKELRDMVVFAPQNVLQDPPFSRLDVCTCRNLLIYLEPEVQRRVLSLVHFGLRDGGALFLGTSETVAGADDMFELLDKRWRIYRRVGPTRHGQVEFPMPRILSSAIVSPPAGAAERAGADGPRAPQRMSIPQLTERALLVRYTPAAVVIDREYRVVLFHGRTDRFLAQPAGEPTRELLLLCRETVRGAVRTALTQAVEGDGNGHARDGTIETDDGLRRVWVSVAPLDGKPPITPGGGGGYLLISFEEREETVSSAELTLGLSGTSEDLVRLTDELARTKDELQSTIEELQSSNEELKASNEEVTSINEEMQSTNEELETSKEELQSLNEELTTVNAQLQAKNDELQGTSSDLASLLASTDIAVIFLDPRMRIRRFTPAVKDLLDLIATDVGRPLSDLHRKFTDDALLGDARQVLERLVPIAAEIRVPTAAAAAADGGGGERWYQRRITPYRTSDDRIDGVVVTFVDITERKRAEVELARAREYAESIVETLHEPLLILHPDLRVKSANLAFYRQFHVSPGDTVGRRVYDLGNGQWNIPALRKALEDVLPANHVFVDYEVTHDFPGLGRRVMLVNGRRLDHLQLILLGIRDITDRHAAAQRVLQSEERLRRMANIEGVGILTFDEARGTLLTANDAFLRLAGYTREDVAAGTLTWRALTAPEHLDASARQMDVLRETGRIGPYEKEYLHKDGSRSWMLFAGASLGDGTVVEYCIDVGGRRRAEEALRTGEERLRLVVEGMRDFAIVMLDPQGRITTWNQGAADVTGFDRADAVGQPGAIIFTPEDRRAGADREELERAARDGRAVDERWHLRKDGTRFWGSGVMTSLRDPDGTVRGFVKVLRDETDRRQAEETILRAKEAAESANVMKDQFLATLSHELRTPLSAILIYSKLLQAALAKDPVNREAVDAIARSAEAQRQLIDDLLDSARITSGKLHIERRDADVREVLRDAMEAVTPAAEARGVALVVKADDPIPAWVDAGRIRQVIWNLLNNAVKFTPEGGRVEVALAINGRGVEIRVSDTGQGIPAEFLPMVFDPFRQADASITRTKGGLGLGLAISRHLVELHGGTIAAESAGKDRGATFTVRLPLPHPRPGRRPLREDARTTATPATPATPATAQQRTESRAPLGGVRVLLVEDDAETRQAVARLAKSWGATVTTATDVPGARSALGLSTDAKGEAQPLAGPPRFDLLLCDIGLPDEDGYDLIRSLRSAESADGGEAPGMPAVAITAFVRDSDRDQALAAGFDRHVGKPAAPEELLAALQQALGRA